MAAKILVVDDDPNVQRLLQYTLKQEGYEVVVAGDGAEGFRLWGAESPDLILLDVMLPKLDGYQVATKIRTEEGASGHVPIIMLTAEREVEQKVRGLRAGADDYLIKPFAFAELSARIRALLRRGNQENPKLRVADLEMDTATRQVRRAGQPIDLKLKEYALLEFLLRNAHRPVTRTMIVEHVWDIHFDSVSNVVDVHINSLRNKIDKGFQPPLIHTVRGVGYMLSDRAA
jgi:two-component system, OmpR family, copper resistance phosphate regulon response regulator CusR